MPAPIRLPLRRLGLAAAVIAVGLLVIRLTGADAGPGADPTSPAPAAVTTALAAVTTATFDRVGAGTVAARPTSIQGTPLTGDGKPQVLYVGGIFCPYCAAERWPVALALMRFGSFSGLQITTSAGNDAYPNTATLSFARATYTSSYLSFAGLEQRDRAGRQVQAPTVAQQAVISRYDNVPGHSDHPIPFLDLGNAFRILGTQVDPGLLKGLSAAQIAGSLSQFPSRVATAIDSSANVLTAGLCELTQGQPVAVCASPGVRAARAGLPAVPGQPGQR